MASVLWLGILCNIVWKGTGVGRCEVLLNLLKCLNILNKS